MVDYETQINQMPIPYSSGTTHSSSKKKTAGIMIAGGLIGMNAYYLPVKKDVFIQRAFDITKAEADNKIVTLKNIAKEIEQNKISTQSKMILQEMGLPQDIVAITNKCIEIDKKVSDPEEVKNLKNSFDTNFSTYKKKISTMDNNCAEAFKAIKRNKFRWGVGIGSAIGLALGLLASRD